MFQETRYASKCGVYFKVEDYVLNGIFLVFPPESIFISIDA